MSEEKLYSEYLSELRELEAFRSRYASRNPSTPLEPEEPGVRRILEAIAYFSTRTRVAAEETMHAASRRLFESYFESLLTPLPARAMLETVVGERMSDPRPLARNSEVQVTAAGGVAATFHTTHDVQILPVWLEKARVFLRPEGGYRLILRFQSRFQRQESVGTLSLHVRYLDDYLASLEILHQLRSHLQKTTVIYDVQADESSKGELCQTTFGPLPNPGAREGGAEVATLEGLRAFFQFPRSELFIHVAAPDRRQGSGWTAFSLCFDLKPGWQEADRSSAEVFRLFAVPLTNQHSEPAAPIVSDGTRTRYPILHPEPKRYFRLHSVASVHEVGKSGRLPVRRSVLPGNDAEYELEIDGMDPDSEAPATLIVHQPAAFTVPRTLAVDAWWHQPWFEAHAIGRLETSLPGQHFEGLRFRLLGDVSPWRASPIKGEVAILTDLLALKMRSTLTLEEITLLLRILCPSKESPYANLTSRIVALSSRSIPAGSRDSAGVRRRYSLTLDRFEPEEEGLMWSFLVHLRALLDAWSSEGPVELEVAAPGSTPTALFLEEFAV